MAVRQFKVKGTALRYVDWSNNWREQVGTLSGGSGTAGKFWPEVDRFYYNDDNGDTRYLLLETIVGSDTPLKLRVKGDWVRFIKSTGDIREWHQDVAHIDWDDHDNVPHQDHNDHDNVPYQDWDDYSDYHVDAYQDVQMYYDGGHHDHADIHSDTHGDHTDHDDAVHQDHNDHDNVTHQDHNDHDDTSHTDEPHLI